MENKGAKDCVNLYIFMKGWRRDKTKEKTVKLRYILVSNQFFY